MFSVATPVLAGILLLTGANRLSASGSYFTTFSNKYAGSATIGASCSICHGVNDNTDELNRYGVAFRAQLSNFSASGAMDAIKDLNSDEDAGGFTNLQEITAGAQPGWTKGLNPVINRRTGLPVADENGPAGILLDPAPAPAPAPNISVSPLSLAFDAVTVGSSATRSTTVQNTGNAALTVSSVTVSGTGFSLDTASSFTVAASSSAMVTVRFTPSAASPASGTLTIASNDADTPSIPVSLGGTGTAPATVCDINVTPTALSFGDVKTGQTGTLSLSVGNTGTAACTVSGLAVTGAEFSAPSAGFTVQPNTPVSVNVAYKPTNLGADTGTLKVTTTNDPDEGTVTVNLSGTGVGVCNLIAPASVAFGTVTVGTTSNMSAQLQNTGTAACSVTALSVTGTGFAMGGTPLVLPATVAAGGTLSVPLRYTPTAAVTSTGSLSTTSDDPDTPVASTSLTGTGQAPAPAPACDLKVDVSSVSFGSVPQGTTANRTVTASNVGTANCSVSNISVSGTGMALGSGAPTTANVAPGATLPIPVAYTPNDTVADTGTLAIASNDPAEAVISVSLSGTGIAPAVCNIQVSPVSLSFGAVAVGSSASRSTTITNNGTANCTVNSLTKTGSSEFTLGGSAPLLPLTLIPGGAASVPVIYTPTDTGDDPGTLVVGSTDPDQPSITVGLAGSGTQTSTACDVQVSALSLNFGSLTVGANATLSTTVKNAGTAACNVTRQLAAGSSTDFALTETGALTIAAGQSATLSVRYTATNAGSDSGSLQIGSNDPAQAVVTVALAGTGITATGSVDLAISEFRVPRYFTLSRSRDDDEHDDDDDHASAITINLVVENRGTADQPRQATVTGKLNGTTVYSTSLSVSAPIGSRKSFQFPSYTPRSTGDIRWTVVIADDVSANSTASATTTVMRRSSRDSDDH